MFLCITIMICSTFNERGQEKSARDSRLIHEMMEMFNISAADCCVAASGDRQTAAGTETLLEGCDSHAAPQTARITSQPWWIRFYSSTRS